MNRPTPTFIFGSTAVVIILLLGMLTSVSLAPGTVQAAAPASAPAAEGGAPEVFYSPAPEAGGAVQPQAEQVPLSEPAQAEGAPPVVEPVFAELSAAEAGRDLGAFIESVSDGSDRLVGVFAAGRFGFPIVAQQGSDPVWVSTGERDVTLFNAPLDHGVTALLAHNNLAGRDFAGLAAGQEVTLVFGDGRTAAYRITGLAGFQAVEPRNTAGDFIDLATGTRLTSGEVFARFYTGAYPLVLQTCIERDGDYFWGRLFLLAEPAG